MSVGANTRCVRHGPLIDHARRLDVIGVPFNSAGTTDGVARAPAAIRRAGLIDALRDGGVDVVDQGDVKLGQTSPERDPTSHIIAPAALAAMIRAVRTTVEASLRTGAFPLVLGGDCPVLLGCLGPPADIAPRGVLFVDGHEDAWPPALSTTGEAADMELGFALGLTVAGLPDDLRGEIPHPAGDDVVILGPRDERELADAGVASIGDVATIVRTEALRADPDAVAAGAAAGLGRRGAWWLHVDLDVLSTDSLGAVDYRQPGGLGWEALTSLSKAALASPGVTGWDVTIYNPDLDPDGTEATRIVRYLTDALRGWKLGGPPIRD
jgi:arginase